MAFTIEPCNEPDGEGNGWSDCADDAPGCVFFVFHDDDLLDSFHTRAEAYAFFERYAIEHNLPTTIPH